MVSLSASAGVAGKRCGHVRTPRVTWDLRPGPTGPRAQSIQGASWIDFSRSSRAACRPTPLLPTTGRVFKGSKEAQNASRARQRRAWTGNLRLAPSKPPLPVRSARRQAAQGLCSGSGAAPSRQGPRGRGDGAGKFGRAGRIGVTGQVTAGGFLVKRLRRGGLKMGYFWRRV